MRKPTREMKISKAPLLSKPSFSSLTENIACLVFASLFIPSTTAQTNYVSSEIERDTARSRVVMEDMNGDDRLDLITSRWQRNVGRELLIYFQLEDGRYSPTPKPIEIKTEIIAIGFADLRDDPGKELVLFTNNGVFSLSTAVEGYAGNLKPLFEWKLIADVPDPNSVQFFMNIRDLDGDGFIDLLVPGEKTYGYFRGASNETFMLTAEFSTINLELEPSARPSGDNELSVSIEINSTDGIKLDVAASSPTPYAGFIEDWQQDKEEPDNLLRAENWMPSVNFADFNGDGRDDMIFINVGLDIRGQVNILFQSDDGSYPSQPSWQGPIDTRGDIRLANLDGDEFMDVVKLVGEGNERDAHFFHNSGGQFNFDQPNQIMRFSGYDVDFNFIDLDNNGQPELNVSYYTIPVVDAIRNTTIVRAQLLYGSSDVEPDQFFSRRPQFRLEESFSATNVRGLAEQMSLRFDVDGDGKIDALYISDEGVLSAKRIDSDLKIAPEPFWEYVPTRTIMGFSVSNLNADKIPDLTLRHVGAITLLVANP